MGWIIQTKDDVDSPWVDGEVCDYIYETRREAATALREKRSIGLLGYYAAARVARIPE
jgi:hypothetical protein